MDRAKALEKIAKCMALGKSTNEHEAAAAMRQAQALMRNFGINEKELGAIGYSSAKVQTAIQAGKKVPLAFSTLISLMRHAFGVQAVVTRELLVSDRNWAVTYYGPEHRVMLAEYSHTVVYRAMEKAWATYIKENPRKKGEVGARAGFQTAWLVAIYDKLEAFGMTPEEERGTQIRIEMNHSNLTRGQTNNQRVDGNAARAGAAAGEKFNLHRPVAGAERLKITG